MKKRVVTIIISIIFITILLNAIFLEKVSSQENENIEKNNFSEATKNLKKAGEVLKKEVEIPSPLKTFVRISLGIKKTENVSLEYLIIVVGCWLIFFFFVYSFIEFLPFFEKGLKRLIGSIILTLLMGMTGGIKHLALYFFAIGDIFKFLSIWSPLRVLFVMLLLIILFFLISFVNKFLKKEKKFQEAEIEGREAGMGVGFRRMEGKYKI